jgi:hypothetical protein
MPNINNLSTVVNARLTLAVHNLDNLLQEFEVKISDSKSHSEPGGSVPSATAGLVPVGAAPSAAPPAGLPPQVVLRILKREVSISDQDAAEQIACDTKIAFEKGELIGGDKRSSNSVEFWMQAMLAHIQSLKRKHNGEADFVDTLDSYASMYWKFVCTRILSPDDWSQAQRLGQILEVVSKEFGSLLSPLGQAVVLLLNKGGGDEVIPYPDMALATRTEFFRINVEHRQQYHRHTIVELVSN